LTCFFPLTKATVKLLALLLVLRRYWIQILARTPAGLRFSWLTLIPSVTFRTSAPAKGRDSFLSRPFQFTVLLFNAIWSELLRSSLNKSTGPRKAGCLKYCVKAAAIKTQGTVGKIQNI